MSSLDSPNLVLVLTVYMCDGRYTKRLEITYKSEEPAAHTNLKSSSCEAGSRNFRRNTK